MTTRNSTVALLLAAGLAGGSQVANAATVIWDFSASDQGFTAAGTTGAGQPFTYGGGQWQVDGVAPAGSSWLDAPQVIADGGVMTLSFNHGYRFETGFDGGQLLLSVNGGAYQLVGVDIGSFSQSGYTSTISTSFSSPIAGQLAWSDDSGGPLTSIANLGGFAAGDALAFRWRGAWDSSISASNPNWSLTGVSVSGVQEQTQIPLPGTLALALFGLGALGVQRGNRESA